MAKSDKLAEKAGDAVKKAGKLVKEGATAAATNAAALNSKVIDHAEENAREAFLALRSAASIRSVKDLAKLQSDYLKEQSARSMAQVREVSDLIARFGKDAMAAVRDKPTDPS